MSRKSFGLIQEGGVYIPKLKHWVLTPKLDNVINFYYILPSIVYQCQMHDLAVLHVYYILIYYPCQILMLDFIQFSPKNQRYEGNW